MMMHFDDRVERIMGDWVWGDNLKEFNQGIEKGLSLEEAAQNAWTGRQVARYGYFPKMVRTSTDHEGYSAASVYFEKPNAKIINPRSWRPWRQ